MIQSVEEVVEPRLRAAGLLGANEQVYGIQYAYRGDVSASGGTHDEGGSLDHGKGNDAETKIWRECGWADWQRGDPEDQSFDDHNHGIVIGCPHLSPAAADQVYDYRQGLNGLASGGPDQSPQTGYITWQEAHDKYAEADVRHDFLYLSTTTDVGPGNAIKFDTESTDTGGFHAPDMAAVTAPRNSVGVFMAEATGGEVKFRKYDGAGDVIGDIGQSVNGDLTIVQDLAKGQTLRVVVTSGTVTSCRLKADIRER